MLRSIIISIIFLGLPLFSICQSSVYRDSINAGNTYVQNLRFKEALIAFEEARLLAETEPQIKEANRLIESTLNRYTEELIRRSDSLVVMNEKLGIALEAEKAQAKNTLSRQLALVANILIEEGKYQQAYDSAYQAKVIFDSLGLGYFPFEIERAYAQAVFHTNTEVLYPSKSPITDFKLIPGSEEIIIIEENKDLVKITTGGKIKWIEEGKNELIITKFSKDGKFFFASYPDSTSLLINLELDSFHTFSPHNDLTVFAEFTNDGQYLITCSRDNTAKLWNLDRELLATLVGHKGNIYEATISDKERIILTRSNDGTVRLWDFNGQIIGNSLSHSNYIYSAQLSEDGSHIMSASGDGTVKKWGNKGEFLADLTTHSSAVIDAAFLPETEWAYSYSLDHAFKLFNWVENRETSSNKLLDKKTTLNFAPISKKLFLGLVNGQLYEYDLTSKQEKIIPQIHNGHLGAIVGIDHHSEKDLILSTADDNNSHLLMSNRKLWMNIPLNSKSHITSKFSHNGTMIYSVIDNKLTTCPLPDIIWDKEKPE